MRKNKEENKKQKSRKSVPYNIPMTLACVLFCLTLVTTHMTGGLYARYVAADSAADIARVAKFNVGHEIKKGDGTLVTDLSLQLVPGVHQYGIDIINNSEVDVNCTIAVTNTTDNLPLHFNVYTAEEYNSMQVNSTTNSNILAQSVAVNFAKTYSIDANSGKTSYILTVTFPQENSADYINMLDIVQLSILTEQKD